jgi:hypothetical protein
MTQKLVACVFLSLFLLTIFVGVSVNSVSAAKIAMEWGHLNEDLQNYNPSRYSSELTWENSVCSTVNSLFAGKGWACSNSYGASTTRTNVYNVLDNVAYPSNGVTTAATFWVGDFNHPPAPNAPSPYGYFGCYTDVANSYVIDYEIYNHATAYGTSKQHFTFMWTCANGGLYWGNNGAWQNISGVTWYAPTPISPPPSNPNTQYGYNHLAMVIYPYMFYNSVGMPYAWTGTTGMNINGYVSSSGSHTYIGWENNSPFMIDTPPTAYSSTNLQYRHFVTNFYRYALGYETNGVQQNVRDSLDYAAKMTFGVIIPNLYYNFNSSVLNVGQWLHETDFPGFTNCWFYCKLRVFGNGAMYIQ